MFHPFPILSTDRIVLNEIQQSDNFSIFDLRSNHEVIKYIKRPPYQTIKEANEFIKKIQKGVANNDWINWKIRLTNNDTMIGSICIWNFSKDHKTAEIGYDLMPQYHGKGIMSEAMKLVLHYGFTHLKLDSILAYTDQRNIASKSLLKKHPFIHQKEQFDKHNDMNEIYQLNNNKE